MPNDDGRSCEGGAAKVPVSFLFCADEHGLLEERGPSTGRCLSRLCGCGVLQDLGAPASTLHFSHTIHTHIRVHIGMVT